MDLNKKELEIFSWLDEIGNEFNAHEKAMITILFANIFYTMRTLLESKAIDKQNPPSDKGQNTQKVNHLL